MSTTPPQTELLTDDEAAMLLGISVRSFHQLRTDGKLGPDAVRFSLRCVRYRRQELLAWVSAGCPVRSVWAKQQTTALAVA